MTKLSPQRQMALRHVMRCSALANHHHLERVLDMDTLTVDIAAIDDYGWSSGEEVLVELIKTISGFSSNLKVQDLWKLDEGNREVAIKAIEMSLTGHGLGADLN